MEAIKQVESKGYRLSIYTDDNPESPREWDNLGTMVCFHKRYDLGDKTDIESSQFESWEDLNNYLVKILNAVVVLPLRLYDHSGISMSTSTSYPYNCQRDSMNVGFIYVTKDRIIKEYGKCNKETIEKATKVLQSEVKTYDHYLRGNVYGFVIEKKEVCKECKTVEYEHVDSCWGFYGDNIEENIKGQIEEKYNYLVDLLD